jgi:hypothetical protein
MGVSGCGKSTVGRLLSASLGVTFRDGDDLHSATNKAKMASGVPLTDEDRWPWLASVGETLSESDSGVVVACSALKRIYRDAILEAAPGVFFVHLHGSREVLLNRMENRGSHFMKPEMLDSQLEILERLDSDETGETFDIALPVEELVDSILKRVSRAI